MLDIKILPPIGFATILLPLLTISSSDCTSKSKGNTHMHTRTHMHTYIHTYTHACMHACIYTHTYTHIHTRTHAHIWHRPANATYLCNAVICYNYATEFISHGFLIMQNSFKYLNYYNNIHVYNLNCRVIESFHYISV